MEFFADWHTHSKYSDGRGTIEENVMAAQAKGLKQIGITDHGPANIGVGVKQSETYLKIKNEIAGLNTQYADIQVQAGAEADIIDLDGTIDISDKVIKELDILIVGLHPHVIPKKVEGIWSVVGINKAAAISSGAKKKAVVHNTKALKEAVFRYDVDFISHPGLGMPVDFDEIASFCALRDTAIEINTGHHYDKSELVRTVMNKGVNFVVNSDAHFPDTVGNLDEGARLLEKFNVPPEQVLNAVR